MSAWKDAEAEFESWFSGKDQYCHKIEDHLEATKVHVNRSLKVASRPSDFIVVDRGDTYFAEVKSSKNETSFPFANIKVPQWNAARRTVAAGGSYFFFLKNETAGLWFKVPAKVLVALKFEGDIKSVKWIHIAGFIYMVPK